MYEIMLNSDIYTIGKLCQIDKICPDDQFWIAKFKHDSLPIFNNPYVFGDYTFKDWVNQYIETNYAYEKALFYLNDLKYNKIHTSTLYQYDFETMGLNHLYDENIANHLLIEFNYNQYFVCSLDIYRLHTNPNVICNYDNITKNHIFFCLIYLCYRKGIHLHINNII